MPVLPWRRRADAGAAPAPAATSVQAEALGWDAVTAVFARAYPDQEPRHVATAQKYRFGGPDPLDGVSVYRSTAPAPHWHYVTYGYSDLYGQLNRSGRPVDGPSGYGIEMTLRLADPGVLDPASTAPGWVVDLLQTIARYVFSSGHVIRPHHHLDLGRPLAPGSTLSALAFTDDPISPPVSTPNGTVRLVLAVGLTAAELEDAVGWNTAGVLDVIGRRWPGGLTVPDRPGLDTFPELHDLVVEGRARDASAREVVVVGGLDVSPDPSGLVVALAASAVPEFALAVRTRLGDGHALPLAGARCVVTLTPLAGAESARRGTLEGTPADLRIPLTPAGIEALACLPTEPGDHRLDAIPGVVWRVRQEPNASPAAKADPHSGTNSSSG